MALVANSPSDGGGVFDPAVGTLRELSSASLADSGGLRELTTPTTTTTQDPDSRDGNWLMIAQTYRECGSFRKSHRVDVAWMLVCGFRVFAMQGAFALLESGTVRREHVTAVMLKNLGDIILGTMAFWFLGYGLAFAEYDATPDGVDPNGNWWPVDYHKGVIVPEIPNEAFWFFQYSFAATATTIVSGMIAERNIIRVYLDMVMVITGFVYPISAYWVWGSGFVTVNLSFIDFAGSAVVHMTGGAAGLAYIIILGPRTGFNYDAAIEENLSEDYKALDAEAREAYLKMREEEAEKIENMKREAMNDADASNKPGFLKQVAESLEESQNENNLIPSHRSPNTIPAVQDPKPKTLKDAVVEDLNKALAGESTEADEKVVAAIEAQNAKVSVLKRKLGMKKSEKRPEISQNVKDVTEGSHYSEYEDEEGEDAEEKSSHLDDIVEGKHEGADDGTDDGDDDEDDEDGEKEEVEQEFPEAEAQMRLVGAMLSYKAKHMAYHPHTVMDATYLLQQLYRLGLVSAGDLNHSMAIKESSSHVQILFGTLLLWVGWYGFNPGSTLSLLDDNDLIAARVAMTTTFSAVGGGFMAVLLNLLIRDDEGTSTVLMLCIGIMSGLVGSCAGTHLYDSGGAFIVGCISFLIGTSGDNLLRHPKIQLDDPLAAFGIHCCGGFWGALAPAFFAAPSCMNPNGPDQVLGVFYGGGFKQVWRQMGGAAIIFVWSFMSTGFFVWGFGLFMRIRSSLLAEVLGAEREDRIKHKFRSMTIAEGHLALEDHHLNVFGDSSKSLMMARSRGGLLFFHDEDSAEIEATFMAEESRKGGSAGGHEFGGSGVKTPSSEGSGGKRSNRGDRSSAPATMGSARVRKSISANRPSNFDGSRRQSKISSGGTPTSLDGLQMQAIMERAYQEAEAKLAAQLDQRVEQLAEQKSNQKVKYMAMGRTVVDYGGPANDFAPKQRGTTGLADGARQRASSYGTGSSGNQILKRKSQMQAGLDAAAGVLTSGRLGSGSGRVGTGSAGSSGAGSAI